MIQHEAGCRYLLHWLDGEPEGEENALVFVNRRKGQEHPGTTNQEVLRALINRVHCLDFERHWEGNAKIIHHLRMALVLQEARALIRKVEKGDIDAECVMVDQNDGHFQLRVGNPHYVYGGTQA